MKFNIFYLILAILHIAACNKEEFSVFPITSDTTLQALVLANGENNKEDGNKDKELKDCFELVYPLSVTMPDGSVLAGENEDLWEAVKAWYEANPNSQEKPSLNYPVEILWLEGEVTKKVSDEYEMKIAKEYCDVKKEVKDCFKLIYPVIWTMPDGSTIATADIKEWDGIKEWYENNPNSKGSPILNYPVDIIFKNGIIQTLNNQDDMVTAKKDCK